MRVIPFALTIFLSAFLLFQVQPLIARYILPWFGGSAGVWSVTMLFFQLVLLGGYGYAHLLNSRLKPRAQAVVHCIVLVLGAALLPIIPREALKPQPDASPIIGILLLLAATVGAPYFALSATGPLLQAWFSRALPGKSPYPLYALSNVGSLLALVSYPFVFEPMWGRQTQATSWSWGFCVFALCCAGVAVFAARLKVPETVEKVPEPRPSRRDIALWIALPGVASSLLLAFTHELCVDVASVPFLWVLPLSLYLVSFIVTFAGKTPMPRLAWYPMAAIALAVTGVVMAWHFDIAIQGVVIAYSVCLLVLCVVLHSETFRVRPGAARLTQFYLCVSLGGVLGGLFVAVLAPLLFPLPLELPISMVACAVLLAVAMWTDTASPMHRGEVRSVWGLIAALVAGLCFALSWTLLARYEDSVLLTRNFYGTYAVIEPPHGPDESWARSLRSGTTLHGSQFMAPEFRHWPTTYYARAGGVGLVAEALPEAPRKVGVVGLGVGTMAAYGRAGDEFTFYEINPRCAEVARSHFYYLKESAADCEVVIGDARLSLEREPSRGFDLLVLDAFTSDSIPVHLLTLEALNVCKRHLRPDGVLCVHISNRHLDLAPVLRAAAPEIGGHMFAVSSRDDDNGASGALWVVICSDSGFEDRLRVAIKAEGFDQLGTYIYTLDKGRRVRAWTDDFSNLFDVLK